VTSMDLRPDLDAAPWTDLKPATSLHGQLTGFGLLRGGTSEGRASVAIRIQLDDGRTVSAETTWRLFTAAARALAASPVASEEVTEP
jgi:hypothetical protein